MTTFLSLARRHPFMPGIHLFALLVAIYFVTYSGYAISHDEWALFDATESMARRGNLQLNFQFDSSPPRSLDNAQPPAADAEPMQPVLAGMVVQHTRNGAISRHCICLRAEPGIPAPRRARNRTGFWRGHDRLALQPHLLPRAIVHVARHLKRILCTASTPPTDGGPASDGAGAGVRCFSGGHGVCQRGGTAVATGHRDGGHL